MLLRPGGKPFAKFPDRQYPLAQVCTSATFTSRGLLQRGTHLGEFMGVTPTQKQLAWGGLMLDQIVDGRIVVHYAYLNYVSVLLQFGVIPVPRGAST